MLWSCRQGSRDLSLKMCQAILEGFVQEMRARSWKNLMANLVLPAAHAMEGEEELMAVLLDKALYSAMQGRAKKRVAGRMRRTAAE